MSVIFITGIDTGVGKTYVTGLLAHYLKTRGISVITSKIVQTGCQGISEDIILHRKLMREELTVFDQQGITCPYVLQYPASPHLAACRENKIIIADVIDQATEALCKNFSLILMEGVGGIYVPLTNTYTVLDFLKIRHYPCLVVTSPKLGSINHTLLTLETLRTNNIPILGLCYSLAIPAPPEIIADTQCLLQSRYPEIPFVVIPVVEPDTFSDSIDFSLLKID